MVEHAAFQRFGKHDVLLAVDVAQQLPLLAQSHVRPVALHVSQLFQDGADTVELPGHGSGARLVPVLHPLVFAHLANPAMTPFHMLLHVGALPARMFAVALLQGLDRLVQLAERVLALLVGREGGLLELAPAVLLQVGQLHADAHQRRESPYSQWNACS